MISPYLDKVIRRLPPGVLHYPMDTLLAALSGLSGSFVVTGLSQNRVFQVLPDWVPLLWGIVMVSGAIAWLVGILTVMKIDHRVVIRFVPTMVLGLGLTGIACLFYALTLVFVAGWAGVTSALPLLAFSIGAYLRRWKLMNLDSHE